MLGHLRPQAETPVRAAQHAGELRKGRAEDLPALGYGGMDYLGPAALQQGGDVHGLDMHGRGAPLPENAADLNERALPLHLVPYVGGQQPQVLGALDLHPGPSRDGYVQVLAYGAQSALDLAG